MSALERSPVKRELAVERRLADFLANHDAPVSEHERAELRARIRQDMVGER